MNKKLTRGIFATATALLFSQAPYADEFTVSTGERPITIGIAALHKDKPYRDYHDGDKTTPLPLIMYEGQNFFFRASTLGWKFGDVPGLEVAIIGQFIGDGYDSSDSHFLKGMDDRDPTFGVGGHIQWKPEDLGVKLTAVTDISGNSEGNVVRGELFWAKKTGAWLLKPSAAAIWQDDDYVDYYYGVKNKEAVLPERPRYSADEEITYRVQFATVYQQQNSPWMFIGGVRYDFFGDEIDDSPITNDDQQLTAAIGVAYSFGK